MTIINFNNHILTRSPVSNFVGRRVARVHFKYFFLINKKNILSESLTIGHSWKKIRKKNKFSSCTEIVLKMFFIFGTNRDLFLKKLPFWHFFGNWPESERKKKNFWECIVIYHFHCKTEFLNNVVSLAGYIWQNNPLKVTIDIFGRVFLYREVAIWSWSPVFFWWL
jgi:hypothetical protein